MSGKWRKIGFYFAVLGAILIIANGLYSYFKDGGKNALADGDNILTLPIYQDMVEDYQYLNERYGGGEAIVLIGDSITRRFNVNEYFPGLPILNRGIYYDTTYGLKNRIANNVNNMKVKKLFILIGYNDLRHRSNEEITENIASIVSMVKADRIYLQSILPVGKGQRALNERIVRINKGLKEVCRMKGAEFLDLHSAFIDSNGEMRNQYTRDGVHPNSAGYRLWSRVLDPAIR